MRRRIARVVASTASHTPGVVAISDCSRVSGSGSIGLHWLRNRTAVLSISRLIPNPSVHYELIMSIFSFGVGMGSGVMPALPQLRYVIRSRCIG